LGAVCFSDKTLASEKDFMLDPSDPKVYNQTPYFFGVDPVRALVFIIW